eukprot:31436-Pelagococcus_subviridis.AAC.5
MVVGIESEGWAERCAGKSPSETAFTTPTRSYGNQRRPRARVRLGVLPLRRRRLEHGELLLPLPPRELHLVRLQRGGGRRVRGDRRGRARVADRAQALDDRGVFRLRVEGNCPYEATSGWSRKASEAELKGVEVRASGLKPWRGRRETNAGRESP